VLRRILDPRWSKLREDMGTCFEEFHMYSSLNVIRIIIINSWRMNRVGYVGRMGEMRNEYKISVGTLKIRWTTG
jgi:hypothetical protein